MTLMRLFIVTLIIAIILFGLTALSVFVVYDIVNDNPNRLMEDEVNIIRGWGIKVETKPTVIRYYPKSQRVTVTWQSWTVGKSSTIELFMIAPPNDTKKRQKVQMIINMNPKEKKQALASLKGKGIVFSKWWETR